MAKFLTGYMDNALFNLSDVIETAQDRLAGVDFDTMVGTGFSGGVVIPALALAMDKKFLLVRKEGDDSHHSGKLIGQLGERWLFVDDFVSSGRTRSRVMAQIGDAAGATVMMVGQYLYQGYTDIDDFVRPGSFRPFSEDWMPEGGKR